MYAALLSALSQVMTLPSMLKFAGATALPRMASWSNSVFENLPKRKAGLKYASYSASEAWRLNDARRLMSARVPSGFRLLYS